MKNLAFKLFTKTRSTVFTCLGIFDSLLGNKNDLFIFCYHSIDNDKWRFSVTQEEFEKQINYLLTKYEHVTLEQIEKHIKGTKKITKPSFSLTFDDGYQSVTKLVTFLKSKNIKPTVFVLSEPKNANRLELENNKKMLNKSEIEMLRKAGWNIESHSATHAFLPKSNDLIHEIKDSKKEAKYIAYPKGGYNQKVINEAKKAGYKMGLSMDDGQINQQTNIFAIPRIGVDGTHKFEEFKYISSPTVCKARGLLKNNNLL